MKELKINKQKVLKSIEEFEYVPGRFKNGQEADDYNLAMSNGNNLIKQSQNVNSLKRLWKGTDYIDNRYKWNHPETVDTSSITTPEEHLKIWQDAAQAHTE